MYSPPCKVGHMHVLNTLNLSLLVNTDITYDLLHAHLGQGEGHMHVLSI